MTDMSRKKLRLSVIGAGSIAEDHFRAIEECDCLSLAAVCDIILSIKRERWEIDMKREIRLSQSVSRRQDTPVMSAANNPSNAVRFFFAQLFFGFFSFTPIPI